MCSSVSVVIPCYNAESTIVRAIASVRAQGMDEVEIIVADDGSRDHSRRAVRRAGSDVVLVELGRNRGVSAARNAGLRVAKGDYVAFLDADDEFLPDKLVRQRDQLDADPRLGLVATEAEALWPDGRRRIVFPPEFPRVTGPEAWRALLCYPYVLTSATMARTDLVRRVGGFDERLPVAEDQDLWIRLAMVSDLGFLPEVLVQKHVRPDSLCNSIPERGMDHIIPMVKRHLEAGRARLTEFEVRQILGRRLALEGRHAYYSGMYRRGLALLGRAMLMAHDPLGNGLFLLKHSPPGRWLRRTLIEPRAGQLAD